MISNSNTLTLDRAEEVIIKTVLRNTERGSLICGGLFSLEPLSNWFSAVALSHALIEDVNHKEQLLAVLLATNIGTPPVTLMQQCITLLRQSNNIQSNIGIAMLVCTWISYCPLAVERFLSIDTCMPHLMAFLSSNESNDDQYETILQSVYAFLIAICVHFNNNTVLDYTKEKLCYLIFNRIGIEKFQDMIGGITRHEIYSRSLKQPFTYAKNPEELLLDHEFCRIFKSLEGTVLKSVLDCNKSISSGEKFSLSASQESSDITKFKSVIREQDSRIQQLNLLVDSLQIKNDYFQQEVHKLKHDVNSLTDQNKVLRAAHTNHSADYLQKSTQTSFDFLEQQETSLENKIFILQNTLQEKNKELTYLKKDQEDLLELLTDQERKIGSLTKKIINFGGKLMPASRHSNSQPFTFKDLKTYSHVFQRMDSTYKPLEQP
ncbi:general vesicular transport factor p115-like [Copidosoma floridanum]|uniref:general vesicular transport factor p115-like n=1 Tax=Copidosoma floridanum TaxID=29053 RepID=UPI000C6F79E8|nr:general vesicular transport factor p115-like [Copidosoma floridanum]